MSSVFKIYSPEDCDFYYDGELQGHIDGNSKKAFRFEVERKGVYRLEFINSEYQTELMMKVSIDADEEREVELDFSEVNEPVIQERERIINAIEHDYKLKERLPEEIISVISKDGIVTIPKGVRKIGNNAFAGCSNLKSITILDSVTKIGEKAFYYCGSLTSVNIPDSVTKIGGWAFFHCSLTSITIPNSVTKIEKSAFASCFRLTSVDIPDSITEIGDWGFASCCSLTSVTIPNSVTKIGEGAFSGCSSLKSFYGKYASSDNRCLITDDKLLAFAPYDITEYTIPNGVASIGDRAFYNCSSLTSVNIPDSITEIGDWGFASCCSLTSVTIPNSVTKIGEGAFYNCSSLTSVNIPDSVTEIGDWAFYNCSSLASVSIPKSVTEIREGAFSWCRSLTSIYCKATTPPNIEDRIFYSNAPDLKIYVPKSEDSTVLKAYKSVEGWKDYADIIEEYDFDNE